MPDPSRPLHRPGRISAEESELITRLRSTLGRLEAGLATISDALVITDRDGVLLWCNQAFERLSGRSRLLLLGQAILSLLPPDAEGQPLLRQEQLNDPGPAGMGLRAVLQHEPLQAVAIEWRRVLTDPEWPLVFCIRDISADLTSEAMRQEVRRIAAERQQLEAQALACAVTGLPNRRALEERLERAFRELEDTPGRLTLLFCDLNGFKQVNDQHGHAAGDALLVTIARRLQACLRPSDLVCRLGGDEFVVVSEGPATPQEAMTLAVRLLEEVGRPWTLAGRILHPSMSVGIAMTDDPGLGGAELLRRADLAMYDAKGSDNLPACLHNSALELRSRSREQLGQWLQQTLTRHAPEREGLTLRYRPIVNLQDGLLVGHEATLELRPPDGAFHAGAEALALAERMGLVGPLGRWTRGRALARLGQSTTPADAGVVVFQVSAAELGEGGLSADLAAQADRHGVDPSRIALTLADELLNDPPTALLTELEALRELGVQLVLDGFGTGTAHLNALARLPLTAIRLHPSLSRDPEGDTRWRTLRQATVRLVLDLDLALIAEGIDNEAQREAMHALGCQWGQGAHFGPASL